MLKVLLRVIMLNHVYLDVELKKDKEFNFNLPSTHNTFIYLINGEIEIGEKQTR